MRLADPYSPPVAKETATQELASVESTAWLTPLAFIGLPLLLGTAGFAGYIALAFALEVKPTENEPVLSHGQQAILISLPMCTLIAAAVGLALAFLVPGQRLIATFLLSLTATVGYASTRSLWAAQIAQYGRDPSEIVLYYPPAGYSAGAAVLAVLVTFWALHDRVRRRTIA